MKFKDILNKLHFLKNYQHNIELKINRNTFNNIYNIIKPEVQHNTVINWKLSNILDELRRYDISSSQDYLKFLQKNSKCITTRFVSFQ